MALREQVRLSAPTILSSCHRSFRNFVSDSVTRCDSDTVSTILACPLCHRSRSTSTTKTCPLDDGAFDSITETQFGTQKYKIVVADG